MATGLSASGKSTLVYALERALIVIAAFISPIIAEFTAISADYEPPLAPDLTIDTSSGLIEDYLKKLLLICS